MVARQPYTLDRTVRLVINCVLVAAAVYLLHLLRGVLLPFFVGCLIAYMFEPFVQFNRHLLHLKGRVIAVFVTLFEIAFMITAVCYFVFPIVTSECADMAAMVKHYATTELKIPLVPESFHKFLRNNIDFDYVARMFSREQWMKMAEDALTASWSVISSSISFIIDVFSWLLVLLYLVFVMLDYDRIARGFKHAIPPRYRQIGLGIAKDVKDSMNRYFRGQALVATIVGVLFAIGFSIVGLPMAILLGLFIGVLNMVPYLQLISLVPTTLLCIICAATGSQDFWTLFWECIAVYCVVQMIQDLFLTPKIIGKAMSLNPALIFLSLSVWGTLLGFLGLIIAIPMTTLLLAYYDRFVIRRQEEERKVAE